MAREIAKDPLILDFLGLTEEAQEHVIEEAMTLSLSQTSAEFGAGFAFVGRQYHLDVDGDDFYIGLLLYHVPSDRYVVFELKTGKFMPEHLGQFNSACIVLALLEMVWARMRATTPSSARARGTA